MQITPFKFKIIGTFSESLCFPPRIKCPCSATKMGIFQRRLPAAKRSGRFCTASAGGLSKTVANIQLVSQTSVQIGSLTFPQFFCRIAVIQRDFGIPISRFRALGGSNLRISGIGCSLHMGHTLHPDRYILRSSGHFLSDRLPNYSC